MKSNSVGSGHVSHCETSSLYDHLDLCFVVFKDVQQSFLTVLLSIASAVSIGTGSSPPASGFAPLHPSGLPDAKLVFSPAIAALSPQLCNWCIHLLLFPVAFCRSSILHDHSTRCSRHPKTTRTGPSIRNPVQRNDFRLCRTVPDRSLFLAHPTNWNKCSTSRKKARHLLRLILSPQSRQQSLSLETNPVCNAVVLPT